MPIPDYQTLMLPLLKFVADGQEHTYRDTIEALAKEFNISEEERKELLPSGQQPIFDNRVGWAKSYLKQAGLISSPKKAIFSITELGIEVLKRNPEKINRKFLLEFESFRNFINIASTSKTELSSVDSLISTQELCFETNQETPDEMIGKAKNILSSNLESDLLSSILDNTPIFFERLVAKLLFKMGYGGSEKDILQSCGKSGDGGIDGIINQDVLGLDQIHIQAKRYKSDNIVQVGALRDFCGALYGKKNPKGVFITSSSFTKPAIEFAKDNDLILIDSRKLTKLMIEYNIGVQIKDVIEIKKIDNDFFEENV